MMKAGAAESAPLLQKLDETNETPKPGATDQLCVFPRPFVCARASSPLGRLRLRLCCMPRRPPDAIAATAPLRRRPKNLKLKLGDYLEYTPATGEPKNGAPGKPRATRVERAPRPKKVARAVSFLWVFTFSPLRSRGYGLFAAELRGRFGAYVGVPRARPRSRQSLWPASRPLDG